MQEKIKPIKVKDLPAFLAAIEPVMRELVNGDILAAFCKHTEGVITATAIGAGVELSWLKEQKSRELVDLVTKVVEANEDFFSAIGSVIKKLDAMTASGGTNGSRGSSQPDSATATS